ncbi:transposase [Halomonas sp. M4R1S46]|uniref:transposase n=1 Tax=Halomonas sp. M4R1S46 TaxID=2982692 RepID=UPI0021E4A18B|nr:transposase [Halomonas sp. M4R1S46]UYG08370.1 transposase [Halomonas sp. M4R1S46]
MKAKTRPECPKCGSRVKRFPPGRHDQYHVYCDGCGHDFGRHDYFQAQFRHLLDDLEAQLKAVDNPSENGAT